MIKNADGYNDPTVDRVFSNIMSKPMSEQDAKSLSRIKHLMNIIRSNAKEFGFDIEERVVLRDKQTGKVFR